MSWLLAGEYIQLMQTATVDDREQFRLHGMHSRAPVDMEERRRRYTLKLHS